MGNPFYTYAGLSGRAPHEIHVYLRNAPEVQAYQFWGHSTVNGAYGNPAGSGVGGTGPTAMFQVNRGTTFRSPLLRQSGRGHVEENRRGTTHAIFDLDDYVAGGSTIPPDNQWLFLRAQENRQALGGLLTVPGPLPVLGPVFCVPSARSRGLISPTFTLQGIAPSAVVGVAAGSPPPFTEDLTTAAPRPLYLVLPTPMTEFALQNLDGAKNLLLSFGPDQLMQSIAPGNEVQLYTGSTKALILATADAGGCPWALHGVLSRG